MKNIFVKVLEAGVYTDLKDSDKKRIRLLNAIILIPMVVLPVIAVIDLLNGYYFTLPFYFSGYAMSITEQILVKRRHYEPAKYMVFLVYLLITMLFIIVIGEMINLYILVIYSVVPLLIFESKRTAISLMSVVLIIFPVIFTTLKLVKPMVALDLSLLNFYIVTGAIMVAIILSGISLYSRSITDMYEAMILKEKKRSDDLLLNILPFEVAEELKEKGSADARHFDDVTVLFTDFKGFTLLSEKLTPQELVDELHHCFKGFDAVMEKYGIEKIKTIGDAYLAVAGLPLPDSQHAEHIVAAATEIRDFMTQRRQELGERTFEIRIGVNSGSVVAGIVGVKKFAYDIWGDTVNTAARMEQNSEPSKINISQSTYELIKDKYTCTYRGEINAKNKGELGMYFVESIS